MTPMLTEVLFTIANKCKLSKCPLKNKWIKKMWYIHTIKYYSVIKRKTISSSTTWIELAVIMLSEISQTKKDKYCMISLICRIKKQANKPELVGNRLLVARDRRQGKSAKILVAHSCLTLCNPMDYSPPGSSIHEIIQARILEWVAIPFPRISSQPKDQTQVSCFSSTFFIV